MRRKTSCSRVVSSSNSLGGVGARDARELLDHAGRDRRREQRFSSGDGADRGDQLLGRVVLEDEPAGAGRERLVDVLVERERGQDQDPRARRRRARMRRVASSPSSSGMRMSISTTVGLEAGRLVDRLEPVARLGDDLDVGLAGEQHPEAGAHHGLVVGDEDADRHGRSPPSGRRALRTKPPSGAVPAVISPP